MTSGIDVLRTVKREYGPNRYTRLAYARNSDGDHVLPNDPDASKMCSVGIIGAVSSDTIFTEDGAMYIFGSGIEATELLADKLMEQHPELRCRYQCVGAEPIIVSVSDSKGGYAKIMQAIDAILVEAAPKTVGTEVEERELVGV